MPALNYFMCVQVTHNEQYYGSGDNFEVTLSALEAYVVQETNEKDISGALIVADKPVAVFSGNIEAGNGLYSIVI